jgi:hypothetical protein
MEKGETSAGGLLLNSKEKAQPSKDQSKNSSRGRD